MEKTSILAGFRKYWSTYGLRMFQMRMWDCSIAMFWTNYLLKKELHLMMHFTYARQMHWWMISIMLGLGQVISQCLLSLHCILAWEHRRKVTIMQKAFSQGSC